MLPTGSHEDISGFLVAELNLEIRKQKLPYSIPRNCLLKPLAPRSGYQPDVAIINRKYINAAIPGAAHPVRIETAFSSLRP